MSAGGHVAVKAFAGNQGGNAEPGALNEMLLDGVDRLSRGACIGARVLEEADAVFTQGLADGPEGELSVPGQLVSPSQAHLPDLLFQGHAADEVSHAGVHVQARVQVGRSLLVRLAFHVLFPVLFA